MSKQQSRGAVMASGLWTAMCYRTSISGWRSWGTPAPSSRMLGHHVARGPEVHQCLSYRSVRAQELMASSAYLLSSPPASVPVSVSVSVEAGQDGCWSRLNSPLPSALQKRQSPQVAKPTLQQQPGGGFLKPCTGVIVFIFRALSMPLKRGVGEEIKSTDRVEDNEK